MCNWSKYFPAYPVCMCLARNCAELPTLENGTKSGSSATVGAVVEFICNSGYVLSGPSSLMCLGGGQWNGTKPKCTGMLYNCNYPKLPSLSIQTS